MPAGAGPMGGHRLWWGKEEGKGGGILALDSFQSSVSVEGGIADEEGSDEGGLVGAQTKVQSGGEN